MTEEKIREIVAPFIKLPAEQIGAGTVIDRSAVQSSILLHRMYARLAEEGLTVGNYTTIRVFGDLLQKPEAGPEMPVVIQPETAGGNAGIGIDIEEVSALPRATDFRREAFYIQNFTPAEISYCILQPDPYESFAGLFSAKEAIVKADERLRGRMFNSLPIGHSPEGKPLFPGFALSISHAGGMAVAVAVPETGVLPAAPHSVAAPAGRPAGATSWVGWLALLLAVLALILVLR
jgi:phosphopantetheinyl transferase (holo-ACP synthase)